MPRIFISYRRNDSATYAGRIRDNLVTAFGNENVFMDVVSIPVGRDFRGILHEAIAKCDVQLVIIENSWLTTTNTNGTRRLDDPSDFVRFEVETALQRDSCQVIPVLKNLKMMPEPDHLPTALRQLAFKSAKVVRDDPDFHRDMKELVTAIEEAFPSPPSPPPEPTTLPSEPSLPVRKRPSCVILIIITLTLGVLFSALVIVANPPPEMPTPSVAPSETSMPSTGNTPSASSTLIPTPSPNSTAMLFDFESCSPSTGWYWDTTLGVMGDLLTCSDEQAAPSLNALRIAVPFAGNRDDEAVGVHSLIPGDLNITTDWSGFSTLVFEVASPENLPLTCRVQPFIKYRQAGGLVFANDVGHEMSAGEWTTIRANLNDFIDAAGATVTIDLASIETVGLKFYCRPSETPFRGLFYIDNIRLEG